MSLEVCNIDNELGILENLMREVQLSTRQNLNAVFSTKSLNWKKFTIQSYLSYLIGFSKSFDEYFQKNPNSEIYFSFEKGFFGPDWEKLSVTPGGHFLKDWYETIKPSFEEFKRKWETNHVEDYLDFSKGIIYGAVAGLGVGFGSDKLGLNQNLFFEGIVRFLSGNGDTIGGIIQRIQNKIKGGNQNSELDSFSVGGFAGMAFGPSIQLIGESIGTNSVLYKTLYTSAYSNADNTLSGLGALLVSIKNNGLKEGFMKFINQPFQRANIIIIISLFLVNLLFFMNTNNVIDDNTKASIHGVLLNIDSILAALYMQYYAKKHYNRFLKIISDKNLLRELNQKYLICS